MKKLESCKKLKGPLIILSLPLSRFWDSRIQARETERPMVTEWCGIGEASLLACPYRVRAATDRGWGARQVLRSALDKLWQVIIFFII